MELQIVTFETAKKLKEVGFNQYSFSTQALVQMWLREKHNIDLTISLVASTYGFYIHNNRNKTNNGENYGCHINYSAALEAGILEAIKLIKSK